MMADVHAGHATGIKLFGTTIEVQVRQAKEEEQIRKDDDDDDQTVEKTRPPDKMIACPRCKSMDTKFCYFNNYNVNQPRHFCKACQRYWTAGGALRNVPVGAGRRRSKPPWDGGDGVLEGCLYDASGVHQFEFVGVVEDWHVAAHGGFQQVFPAKRRRSSTVPSGQNC